MTFTSSGEADRRSDHTDTQALMRDLMNNLTTKVEAAGRIPADGDAVAEVIESSIGSDQVEFRISWAPRVTRFFAVGEMPTYLDHGPAYPLALHDAARDVIARVIGHVRAAGLDPADGTPDVRIDPSTKMFAATWVPRADSDSSTTTPTTEHQENP